MKERSLNEREEFWESKMKSKQYDEERKPNCWAHKPLQVSVEVVQAIHVVDPQLRFHERNSTWRKGAGVRRDLSEERCTEVLGVPAFFYKQPRSWCLNFKVKYYYVSINTVFILLMPLYQLQMLCSAK
jgi:hypothetical protein